LVTRREFLDTLATGAAGLAIASTAKSYGQILGSNDRLNFAVIGLHSRAGAHLSSLKANKSAARISHVCDVDSKTLKKFADNTAQEMGEAPATDKDFRAILQLKEIDAITIAAPDHWHATAFLPAHHRSGGQDCQWPHRPPLLRKGLVYQSEKVNRCRQARASPRPARLGPLARPRATPALHEQCRAL
jgi:hypothetical protein